MFEDVFRLDPTRAPNEPLAAVSQPPKRTFAPGVYSNGLITLLGSSFSREWLADWPPLAGRMEPFAYTAFGDVFLWDTKKNVVQFLEAQYGKLTKATDTIDQLFDEKLVEPAIVEKLLLRDFLAEVQDIHGPLEYGQCYIAVPWQMFGGNGSAKNRDRGAVDVYLSMVGQTHFGE